MTGRSRGLFYIVTRRLALGFLTIGLLGVVPYAKPLTQVMYVVTALLLALLLVRGDHPSPWLVTFSGSAFSMVVTHRVILIVFEGLTLRSAFSIISLLAILCAFLAIITAPLPVAEALREWHGRRDGS